MKRLSAVNGGHGTDGANRKRFMSAVAAVSVMLFVIALSGCGRSASAPCCELSDDNNTDPSAADSHSENGTQANSANDTQSNPNGTLDILPEYRAKIALRPVKTCEEVAELLRKDALEQMNTRLDEALTQALSLKSYGCWYDYDSIGGDIRVTTTNATAAEASSSSDTASDVSTTNNQVVGVDEADFVKNDNKYIYTVSGNALHIIEAWPATTAHEIAKVELEGTPRKLYVYDDYALIYSALSKDAVEQPYRTWLGLQSQNECTYGYACSFTGDGSATQISVFDISNRAQPKRVRTIALSGSFINARRINNAIFTVLSAPPIVIAGLRYFPEDLDMCSVEPLPEKVIKDSFAKLRSANEALINNADFSELIPSANDTVYADGTASSATAVLTDCSDYYQAALGDGAQLTTLLTLKIDDTNPVSGTTIISRPGAVYGSADALYMAVPHENRSFGYWYRTTEELEEATTVHKFALSPGTASATYVASGLVKGHVLNQFAMDQHDGHLRIASTTGHVPNPDVHSTLTVLNTVDGELKTVGQVDDLAPSEDIRSVRFDGDRAFVVTFKKTDPLFVFDLAEPTQPRVMAELKIPGFSTYMHMMDANHLLTIGYDADDQGSFAWFTGVMLQIFDVSDMSAPKLVHKQVIGTRGSSSEALNNHLAFTFFAPKDALALPMTICEGSSGGGSYGTEMTFSGLMVFNVTANDGFSLRGSVDHPTSDTVSCNNWWTNATSQVKRSIFMDDYVYSISEERIKINHLNSLSVDVRDIPLAD